MAKEKEKSRIYSALEVANICGVVNQTAINWINAGYLKAFKTPGGQYRIYPDDLAAFMKERGMIIPDVLLENCSRKNPFSKKTLLIVDDDKGLNSVFAKFLLREYGDIEIFQAFDGFEAGSIMSKERPGCVILDIGLPGIDGLALCQKLMEDDSYGNPYIIIITGMDDETVEPRVKELGAKQYLKKPLKLEDLGAFVGEWYKQ